MPTAEAVPGLLTAAARLSVERTVDRTTVHRHNPSEVFLTDARPVGPENFVAAALLPGTHPHYTGRTGPAGRCPDPMLLLECCRQAETYAAHAFFGVDAASSFILRSCSVDLSAEAARAAAAAPSGPSELRMAVVTGNPRRIGGRLHSLDYDFELRVAGTAIGAVRMEVGYLAPDAYAKVRSRGRPTPPPRSDGRLPVTAGQPVAPARVGRTRSTDTLLLDAVADGGGVRAALRVPVENPSLFDHAQDHVPGMVLMEAARQLAALAVDARGEGTPDRTVLVGLSASFAAFAELDAPVTMTAVRTGGGGSPEGPSPVEMTFHQGGADIARMTAVLAPVPGLPSATGEREG
ncbi:ScbA/BarX family gamma-butyrolactone biosynthesis protein [Kitasatospora sp. SUK 42]|uniref:ScbA/BarX family gamma-butyrolactone biosynthesis protein n=1 Tax=Kitasatospora sp. SUK 42 TaxID=1588882 RepID=UPI0018C98E7A|nr:ScbA/BarX family gamma-butyrolactone biosynthesis protein [Kitasatospora sp. SUK 42]MBV2156637.1 gamma-butyrolactone biosynthesis protein [Kitasatospora sp. SUK 42]